MENLKRVLSKSLEKVDNFYAGPYAKALVGVTVGALYFLVKRERTQIELLKKEIFNLKYNMVHELAQMSQEELSALTKKANQVKQSFLLIKKRCCIHFEENTGHLAMTGIFLSIDKYNIEMKRFFISIFLLFFTPLMAQVSFISVVDEDKHSKKEDFFHTFEYHILSSEGKSSKCQATRIGKNWYATAAHCVKNSCEKACTLQVDLLEGNISALAEVKHTKRKPTVFIHPQFQETIAVKNDFALFKMNLSYVPIAYYKRAINNKNPHVAISKNAFNAYLEKTPKTARAYRAVISPKLPPILFFENKTYRIDRQLSVMSIFDGKRNILKNPYPTDFVKELGFAYTKNFGVKQGMSGSGVMTNTGELAGIISAYLGFSIGKKREENFMFAVFDQNLKEFMEEIMEADFYKLDIHYAYPNYVKRSPVNHQEMITAIKTTQKVIN